MRPIALITGAAGGIGRATARLFADDGWDVIGVDRNPGPALSGATRLIQADIADVGDAERIFADVHAAEGRIDALVNNAAIQVNKPLVQTSPEEWDQVLACNLRSVYLAVRGAYPMMKGRSAAIVNVSSVHAIATSANVAAYAASKGGVLALTRALAIELAPDGIRANAVLPGAVDTPMLRAGLSRGHLETGDVEAQLALLAKRTVMGRVAQPEEIAQTIVFLSDPRRSSFMTGQALVVDGGATCRLSTE